VRIRKLFSASLAAAIVVGMTVAVSAHITASNPGFEITSDFGPRFLPAADFHKAIDYGAAAGVSLPLLEAGSISRLSFADGGVNPLTNQILILELNTTNGHHFRYLHIFNNTALPINSGEFALSTTTAGNLCIIHWAEGSNRTQADYVLAAVANGLVQAGGFPVLDTSGNQARTQTVGASPIAPSGTSGNYAAHMHIDMGYGISGSPLAHIEHAVSSFTVQFLDGNGNARPNGYVVSSSDTATTFIKARVNSGTGKDLDILQIYVDAQDDAHLVRSFEFGGLTADHDPRHTDIENNGAADLDGPVYSDGVRNGVRPGGVGLEDFVYTDWESAQSAVSPNRLADGEHHLVACWTNIREQTNCDTQVSFLIDRSSPTASARDQDDRPIPDGGTTQSSVITITAQDTGSGLAQIDFQGYEPFLLYGTTEQVEVEFAAVNSGTNTIHIKDVAGNTSTLMIFETNVFPIVDYGRGSAAGPSAMTWSEIIPTRLTFALYDPTNTGLLNAQVGGPATLTCTPSSPFPPETMSASCTIDVAQAGDCTFSASNASGVTNLTWKEVQLAASTATGITSDFVGGMLHADLRLRVDSTAGLHQIQSFNTAQPDQVDTRQSTEFGDLPDMRTMSVVPKTRTYNVTDTMGNQVSFQTSLVMTPNYQFGVGGSFAGPNEPLLSPGTYILESKTVSLGPDIGTIYGATITAPGNIGFALLMPPVLDSTTGSELGYKSNIPVGGVWCASGPPYVISNVPIVTQTQTQGEVYAVIDGNQHPIGTWAETRSEVEPNVYVVNRTSDVVSNRIFPINGTVSFRYSVSFTGGIFRAYCPAVDPNNNNNCLVAGGYVIGPAIDGPALAQLNIAATPSSPLQTFTVLPGSNQTLPLEPNISMSGLNVTQAGTIQVSQAMSRPPPGWVDINNRVAYVLSMTPASPPFWSGPFSLSVPSQLQLPPGYDASKVVALFYPNSDSSLYPQIIPASGGNVTLTGPGIVEFVVSMFSNPTTVSLNDFSITSDPPTPTLSDSSSDPRTRQLLSVLASQGLVPAGPLVIAGPDRLAFSPPALVTYRPASSGSNQQFAQVALNNGQISPLAGLRYYPGSNLYAGLVIQLHSCPVQFKMKHFCPKFG
jgi:hypothetical protein